jgi:hypothetical protein
MAAFGEISCVSEPGWGKASGEPGVERRKKATATMNIARHRIAGLPADFRIIERSSLIAIYKNLWE